MNLFVLFDENKTEPFGFVVDRITSNIATAVAVVTTKEENVICNKVIDIDQLVPCIHEEAHTRMILHAKQTGKCRIKSINMVSSDTDGLL